MTKKKSHSEVEFLRGEIRNLKAQIKHLKKFVSRKEKREHLFQDFEETEMETLLKEEIQERGEVIRSLKCPNCKEPLDAINEGGKITIYICPDCKYRCSKRN